MNLRASPEKSWASTPTTTTPCPRKRCHAASSLGASALQGTHQEAQKLSTTTLPRSEARESFPWRSRRPRSKCGAAGCLPLASSEAAPLPWWTTFQISRPSRPATTATDSACRPIFSREATALRRNDIDGRPDLDVVEHPLRVRDVH